MTTDIISAQFGLQTAWFVNALHGITDAESNSRTGTHANSIKWVAGHILYCRMNVIDFLTGTHPNKAYQPLFGKGSTGEVNETFPTIEEIQAQWQVTTAQLMQAMQDTPSEKWLSAPPFQTSIPDTTLYGLVAFFAMHESFHIGQLSLLRKEWGKPSMHMGR
jgi:uncharacterized damage-inducible protein DinB